MSHTTEISGIQFLDVQALRDAVTALNAQGIKCSLKENHVPRAYYGEKQQMMGLAPYALVLEEGNYDVGFYPSSTDPKALVARADFHARYIEKILGVDPKTLAKGETPEQGYMGKLYHAYAVAATTRAARAKGHSVRQVTKADGSVQLLVTM